MNLETKISSIPANLIRKWPRCLIASFSPERKPLGQVSVLGADRSQVRLMDMSLSGAVFLLEAEFQIRFAKAKLGELFLADLRFDQNPEFSQILEFRVLKKTTTHLFAGLESLNSAGRLRISQELKDSLIVENTVQQPAHDLGIDFQNSIWWHGPFDFNLVCFSADSGLFEYDSVCFRWSADGEQVFKTAGALPADSLYSQSWSDVMGSKISLGTNWSDRALGLLSRLQAKQSQPNSQIEQAMQRLRKL